MHVIARRILREFWEVYPDAAQPLRAWFYEAVHATWRTSAELKRRFPSASIITRDRVVFNIAGNKYRLIARVNFTSQTLFIRFIGTHQEYNRIDPESL